MSDAQLPRLRDYFAHCGLQLPVERVLDESEAGCRVAARTLCGTQSFAHAFTQYTNTYTHTCTLPSSPNAPHGHGVFIGYALHLLHQGECTCLSGRDQPRTPLGTGVGGVREARVEGGEFVGERETVCCEESVEMGWRRGGGGRLRGGGNSV